MAESVELAPFRSFDDFLLGSARFQVPNFRDPEKINNRIINNLLYYQTNYFLAAIIVFILIGVIHPVQMVLGFGAVAAAFSLFVYVTNNKTEMKKFKRAYPMVSVAVILLSGYLIVYVIGSVLVFCVGIGLPFIVIVSHAVLRMRNIKNKISNKLEYVGLKRTPMGLLLESLGLESEAGS